MLKIDPGLLIAHVEYASWALDRTLAFVDKLPPEAITYTPANSCRSILATLQHLFQVDWYYFVHLQGGTIGVDEHKAPDGYEELKHEFLKLRNSLLEWARKNVSTEKDTVLHGWGAWRAWQVIMHMSNHTTHHLGQISTVARQAGYQPVQSDWTDLIIFYLQKFPANPADES